MAELHAGQIGRYKIVEEIGRGGFGRVYRAYDPTVGRHVAIKVLTQVSEDALVRFRNEAVVAGNLVHQNIVTVYEYGTNGEFPFLVMEYLDGEDLHRILSSKRPLSLLEKCDIMSQVAEGLYCAHKNGVVHRDMKPANIMVLRDGTVKIMDFGIARLTNTADATRLTQQGFMIGTLRYMAPEQLSGSDLDAKCDIFAYGVIFYELVSGRHPFEAPDAQSLIYKLSFEEPPAIGTIAPGVPDALQRVISRILQKDRNLRYQSLKEVQFDTEPIRVELRRGTATSLLIRARELMDDKRFEQAQGALQQALDLEPANVKARALWESVQQQLQRLSLQPRIDSALNAAQLHLGERRFADAVQAFELALSLDSGNTGIEARLAQARALLEQATKASQLLGDARRELEHQNYTAACRIATEALRHDPKNPDAAEFLKTIEELVDRRHAERQVDEAIRKAQSLMLIPAYDDAIAVLTSLGPNTESPAIREFLLQVRQEKVAYERKQKLRAGMAASTDLLREHKLDEALKCLQSLKAEFPEDEEVTRLLTYIRNEKAARARTEAVEHAARAARSRADERKFEEALAVLDHALKQYPGESALIRLLGSTMAARDAWDRRQAIEAAVTNCEAFRAQGRLAEALEVVQAAQQHYSTEPVLLALLEKVRVEWNRQQRNEAIRQATRKAQRLLEEKEPEAALQAVQAALTSYPGERELEQVLVRAKEDVRIKERARAIEAIRASAVRHSARGEYDAAVAVLDDGLRKWPDAAFLRELRESTVTERERIEKRQRALRILSEIRQFALRASASFDITEQLSDARRIASEFPGDQEIHQLAADAVSCLSEMEKIRREFGRGNFVEVLAICERNLAKFPQHPGFGEFKREAERARRRGFVNEAHKKASAEPDLRKRAQIFEQALQEYPDEAELADELRLTQNKLRLAESIADSARACEQAGRWNEALEKWNSLLVIYEQYPELWAQIARVHRTLESVAQQDNRAETLSAALPPTELIPVPQCDPAVPSLPPEPAPGPLPVPEKPADGTRGSSIGHKTLFASGLLAAASLLAAIVIAPRIRRHPEVAVTAISNAPGTSVTIGAMKCVPPDCSLKLAPGSYTLLARADGYQPSSRQLTIPSGQNSFKLDVTLEPLPELLQVNTNFDSGQVYLDGRRGELRDGQYVASGIAPGRHTIRITGERTEFQAEWTSASGAPPALGRMTSDKDLGATVVSGTGSTGVIRCNCGTPPIRLTGLTEGSRQIAFGGQSFRLDVHTNPTLTFFLTADRNTGTLVVETREDDVRVFLNNRLYRRTTDHGVLRIPADVGNYSIRVEKEGFVPAEPQAVSLRKGEEASVTFVMKHAPAYLEIGGATAGAQVKLDSQTIGETDRNGALRREVVPGNHTIELTKEEYSPIHISETFRAGKVVTLERGQLAMVKLPRTPQPDPKQIEAQEWTRAANSTNPDDVDEFIRSHPGSPHLEQARTRSKELHQQLLAAAAHKSEQSTWEKVDPANKAQLQDYLSRYPAGTHAQEAHARISELDRRAAAELANQRLNEQKEQEQARRAADEQKIVQVLKEFDEAYNRRDLAALQKLWSAVPVAAYRQQFREAADLKFQLQLLGPPVVNGSFATAVCTRSLTYRGRAGAAQTHSERVKVSLGREAAGWLIRAIQLD